MDKISGVSSTETDEKFKQKDLEIEKLTIAVANIQNILQEERGLRNQVQLTNLELLEKIQRTVDQQRVHSNPSSQNQTNNQTNNTKKQPNVYLPQAVLNALKEGKAVRDAGNKWEVIESDEEADEDDDNQPSRIEEIKNEAPSSVNQTPNGVRSKNTVHNMPFPGQNQQTPNLDFMSSPILNEMADFANIMSSFGTYKRDEIPPHMQRVQKPKNNDQ
jgi:hypothetical protein